MCLPKVKQLNLERETEACGMVRVKRQVKQMEDNLEQLRNSLNALNDEYSKRQPIAGKTGG